MKPKYTDLHRYPHGYRKAIDTDVAETIERARKRIKLAKEVQEANQREVEVKVKPMSLRRG